MERPCHRYFCIAVFLMVWSRALCLWTSHAHPTAEKEELHRSARGSGILVWQRTLEIEFEVELSLVWVRSLSGECQCIGGMLHWYWCDLRIFEFRMIFELDSKPDLDSVFGLSHNWFTLGPVYLPSIRVSLHLYPYLCICECAKSKCDFNFPG